MASPPYNFDTSNPTATSDIANYPANEQAFRGTVASAMGGLFDPTTGFGFVQGGTTTQKNALVNPPTYMLFWDTTLAQLSINTGTPGSPTWTHVA